MILYTRTKRPRCSFSARTTIGKHSANKNFFSNPYLTKTLCLLQAYYIFDELFIAGELQETSKKAVLRLIAEQDAMMEDKKDGKKQQQGVFGR